MTSWGAAWRGASLEWHRVSSLITSMINGFVDIMIPFLQHIFHTCNIIMLKLLAPSWWDFESEPSVQSWHFWSSYTEHHGTNFTSSFYFADSAFLLVSTMFWVLSDLQSGSIIESLYLSDEFIKNLRVNTVIQKESLTLVLKIYWPSSFRCLPPNDWISSSAIKGLVTSTSFDSGVLEQCCI